MHFHKYLHPANFEFPVGVIPGRVFSNRLGKYRLFVQAYAGDIFHIRIEGKEWKDNNSFEKLSLAKPSKSEHVRLKFLEDGTLRLESPEGKKFLSSVRGRFFGQCGKAFLFEFLREPGDRFYGMGEKWTGLEHSEKITKFWNTDVWADFHAESYVHGRPAADPVYVSIPYLILKRGNTFIGLLLHNPYAAFMSTAGDTSIAGQMRLHAKAENFYVGADGGSPELYIIYGPTLAGLTRKLQRMVGVTPLPPAWALGYHQCRWGYQSEKDLRELSARFRKEKIPVDGLWLDIDYMDHYKVFTLAKKNFRNARKTLKELADEGRRVVPIIDPGVKHEPGYDVYDRGRQKGAYCQNPQGGEYVGLVWPGRTVFPDFSLSSAREWWAREVADFVGMGFPGAWLDMNDPATGAVENQDMLFDHGRKPHESFHNQYALGMARATREGFLKARPSERPFLLCRSGCTGSSRHTAIWTGDNYSNYHHLANSIPTTLNLALSGIPFNGPDVGGFGGDASPELMMDWFKACFLFPVFRNHTITGSRNQEPWAYGKKVLSVLRHYIRLRYRLRPYLYQLFVQQELNGDALLRPLFYEFPDSKTMPLDFVDDQFMVGPHVMQAPFVQENALSRDVVLPQGNMWHDAMAGRWIRGGRKIRLRAKPMDTPLFVRDGAILPLARIAPHESQFRPEKIDFHIFLSGSAQTSTQYIYDDGATHAYLKGARSEVKIDAKMEAKKLFLETAWISDGYMSGDFTFTTEDTVAEVFVNGDKAQKCASQGVPITKKKMTTWHMRSR